MDILARRWATSADPRSATRSARSAPCSPKPDSSRPRPVPATDPPLISSPQHKTKAPPRQVDSLRLQWVRQRCQEAPGRTVSIASTRPARASEATSWTPGQAAGDHAAAVQVWWAWRDGRFGCCALLRGQVRFECRNSSPGTPMARPYWPTAQLPGCQPAESMPTAPERCLARGPLTKPERMACQWQV